jgi:hypothetical protein
MKDSKLDLPNVTLIALTGINIKEHEMALDYSCRGINFGDVVLVESESDSIDEWSRKIVYDLGDYVKTDYALLIHDDGFVVNPDKWRSDWLRYDYIGSPWPMPSDPVSYRDINGKVRRVGNSVSLRSKRLLDLPKKLKMEWKPFHGFYNEDGFICVNNAHIFEEHGMKFAPFLEAIKFGRETPLPENFRVNPFIFHKYAGENNEYPRWN